MAEFLAVARPQAAVTSVGKNSPYGHTSDETAERLREMTSGRLYRTDEQGTIEFIPDRQRLRIRAGKYRNLPLVAGGTLR